MNFISAFLKDILDFIFNLVGNYGWSVIIFTLLIRIVLLPLDIKSKKSMKRMNDIQPQMLALQKKYAKDQEKLNQKVSELYKKEKINPLSGCLPMLIQLPILFCMFTAMRVVADEQTVQMLLDMKNAIANGITNFEPTFQSFLWIKNVFQPDSFMSTIIPAIGDQLGAIREVSGTILTADNLQIVRDFLKSSDYLHYAAEYGADAFRYSAPMLMWTISIPMQFNGLFILPLLAGFSQILSSKLMTPADTGNPTAQSTNKMMQWFFPIFSIFICATSTAAFALYWVAINVIQIVQQFFVNMYFDKKKPTINPEEA